MYKTVVIGFTKDAMQRAKLIEDNANAMYVQGWTLVCVTSKKKKTSHSSKKTKTPAYSVLRSRMRWRLILYGLFMVSLWNGT